MKLVSQSEHSFSAENSLSEAVHTPDSGPEWRVQVVFASAQFWVLVVVDFVMLLMRDVRTNLSKSPPEWAESMGLLGTHIRPPSVFD
jgi:hypothetical protein